MGTTYLTNDEWANKKGYDTLVLYNVSNVYPTATALTAFRDEAAGLMNEYIGSTTMVTQSSMYLRNLEYRMVELMIDEEQGRQTEDGRPVYIPRDYLYERDRIRLAGINAVTNFNRGVHG